ncbi:MAG: hypothetical protein WCA41_15735 [Candidatus Acidiferrum sp.]
MRGQWDHEIARKRLRTLYLFYVLAVLLAFVVTALVELSEPPRFAAAILVLSVLIAVVGGEGLIRAWNALKVARATEPKNWESWVALPPPRAVRIKDNAKVATVKFLTIVVIFVGFSILFALMLVQLHAYPPKQLYFILFLGAVPAFAGALGLLLLVAFSLTKSRRLVKQGEVTIGTILGQARSTVTYEFKNHTGAFVCASCEDLTGLLVPGMAIPVFFNPNAPEKDQVALCGSSYEVVASIPGAYHG